jgi:hypothetical protein
VDNKLKIVRPNCETDLKERKVEREKYMSLKKVEDDFCKSRSIHIKSELIAQEEVGV